MKKYRIKLILVSIICIFAIQPISAFDIDGGWLDEVVCYPDDDYDWGNDDDWWRSDDSWDNDYGNDYNDDYDDNYDDYDNSYNNNNDNSSNILSAEDKFALSHPIAAVKFYANSKTAEKAAANRYPAASLHNGKGDAFRHAYWCALNVVSESVDLARQMGNAHENSDPNQPQAERNMDLHNNEVGYSIGSDADKYGWNNDRIESEVVKAVNDGRLVTLK